MKTDPTSIIRGASGANTVSFSYQAIAANQRTAVSSSRQLSGAIEDLLETSDRDADGRTPPESDSDEPAPPPRNGSRLPPPTGTQLDLTG